MAAMDAAVAHTFDRETCRLVPMSRNSDVNARPSPDPERAPFDFLATIEVEPQRIDLASGRQQATDARLRHVGGEIVLTALTTGWPSEARRGDLVEHRVADTVRQVYAVSEIHRDGTQRVAFYLNQAG